MNSQFLNTPAFAKEMDAGDPLSRFRNQFHFPVIDGKEVLYFCGNSLGLQPKKVKEYVEQELKDWAQWGVEGHFYAKTPWFSYHEYLREPMAKIVGCHNDEVVLMNSLTTNLHLLMISFYTPDKKRNKIICEGGAFPSDQYALASQAKLHGLNPEEVIIELLPEPGKSHVETSHILDTIKKYKDELALIMIGGVNYYSGQLFDMKAITKAGHDAGARVGFDLAHAAGNVALHLHDWDVDFAVWCAYKYLNGGPGGVGGAFVHRKFAGDSTLPRLAGWWGNDPAKRFTMPKTFEPVGSADAWQLSNAPVLPMAALRASLALYDEAGMDRLTAKSRRLTAYMQYVIEEALLENGWKNEGVIITPSDEKQRGCQLSVQFRKNGRKVYDHLNSNRVIGDWRSPDVIRFAPVPLYNSFEDVYRCGRVLSEALKQAAEKKVH